MVTKRPTISPAREARRKIAEISEYLNSSWCPEKVKEGLRKRLDSLRKIAYGTK